MSGRPDLPNAVQGRPDSIRRAIIDALRMGQGRFIPAADLAHAGYGRADDKTIEGMRSLINESRAGLRATGVPVEILAQGRNETLAYAWAEKARPAPASVPAPAPARAEGDEDAPRGIRISLAPLGTFYDGDRVVGADGVRWERAR